MSLCFSSLRKNWVCFAKITFMFTLPQQQRRSYTHFHLRGSSSLRLFWVRFANFRNLRSTVSVRACLRQTGTDSMNSMGKVRRRAPHKARCREFIRLEFFCVVMAWTNGLGVGHAILPAAAFQAASVRAALDQQNRSAVVTNPTVTGFCSM